VQRVVEIGQQGSQCESHEKASAKCFPIIVAQSPNLRARKMELNHKDTKTQRKPLFFVSLCLCGLILSATLPAPCQCISPAMRTLPCARAANSAASESSGSHPGSKSASWARLFAVACCNTPGPALPARGNPARRG